MKGKQNRKAIILSITIAFILLSSVFSFAGTTTYDYRDTERKVIITRGTQPPASTYSISGIVTDSNGNTLSGVTMTLTGAANSSMQTDSNGFYGFTELNNGSYTVTPSKTGYTFSPSSIPVTINNSDAIADNFTGTAIPPPAAPSGLTATTISPSQINLSWVDNANNETGFKIERKTGAGGTYSQIATAGTNVTAYPDTDLTGNTTYYYRVRAYNGGGDSIYTDEAYATTACSNLMVRITGATPVYYSSLQAAYNAAADGSIIQSRAGTLTENVSINRNISVIVQGGYDCAYTTNSGNVTSLKGILRTYTGGGTLTISNFNIVQ